MSCLTENNLSLALSIGGLLASTTGDGAPATAMLWLRGSPRAGTTDVSFSRLGRLVQVRVEDGTFDKTVTFTPGSDPLAIFAVQNTVGREFAGFGGSLLLLMEFIGVVLYEAGKA